LLAAAAVASGVRKPPHASQDDAIVMVQRDVLPTVPPAGSVRAQFAPGDHVLVQLVDGSDGAGAGSTVKGSIIGKGTKEGTYDVHLWVGLPRRRELLNVPAELVSDATQLEAAEAAQKREADEEEAARQEAERRAEAERQEAERRAEAERQEVERKAEAERREGERKAEAEAERQEAARKAEIERREAELRAEAERQEAERRAAEEAQREAERLAEEAKREAERLAEEEELAKRRAEEAQARLKAAVHAKWEAIRAERLKAAGAENATLEVQREVLRNESFKKQLHNKPLAHA